MFNLKTNEGEKGYKENAANPTRKNLVNGECQGDI